MNATRASRRRKERSSVIELIPEVLEIRSVLVPVDFSAPARRAMHYAARFARQFGARVTPLFVLEPLAFPDFAEFPLKIDTTAQTREAKAKLEKAAQAEGIPAGLLGKPLVCTGSPFAEIVAAARRLRSDLIIISTHGHSGVKHLLLGSTAERVVRHAPCPVLVVRQHEHDFA